MNTADTAKQVAEQAASGLSTGWIIAVIAIGILCVFLIIYLPKRQMKRSDEEDESNRIGLENDLRKTIIQIVAGIIVLAGLFLTYMELDESRNQFRDQMTQKDSTDKRNYQLLNQQLIDNRYEFDTSSEQMRVQLELTRDELKERSKTNYNNFVLDQYTKSLQLMKDTNIAVRLGAIYSLEKLMNSDSDYHDVIIEMFCTYVREQREWTHQKEYSDEFIKFDSAHKREDKDYYKKHSEYMKSLNKYKIPIETDTRAILTVLGRRENRKNEKVIIDLKNTNWIDTDLRQMNFIEFNLYEAHLENAKLNGAHLENAKLWGANLEHANLSEAYLNNADLRYAKLINADLGGANLMRIKSSSPEYDKKTNERVFNDDTHKSRTLFIKELKKAKNVKGIELDPVIMDIIKEEFPELYKRIKEKYINGKRPTAHAVGTDINTTRGNLPG